MEKGREERVKGSRGVLGCGEVGVKADCNMAPGGQGRPWREVGLGSDL